MSDIGRPAPCIMNCDRGATRPIMPIAFQADITDASNIKWVHPDCYRRFLAGVADLDAVRAARTAAAGRNDR